METNIELPKTSWGWVDPSLSVQNLMILKNGSTYIRENVEKWGWIARSVPYTNKRITRFALLREPYERWLSGFVQDLELYFISYFYPVKTPGLTMMENDEATWFFDFLIDKDIYKFDTHAELQYSTLKVPIEKLGLESICFIKMNDRLGDTLNYWCNIKKVKSYFGNEKIHRRDPNISIIYQRLHRYFDDPRNNSRKEKVLNYLQPDYDLYNSVRFVNDY